MATLCLAKPRKPPALTMAYEMALSGAMMMSSTDPTLSSFSL